MCFEGINMPIALDVCKIAIKEVDVTIMLQSWFSNQILTQFLSLDHMWGGGNQTSIKTN